MIWIPGPSDLCFVPVRVGLLSKIIWPGGHPKRRWCKLSNNPPAPLPAVMGEPLEAGDAVEPAVAPAEPTDPRFTSPEPAPLPAGLATWPPRGPSGVPIDTGAADATPEGEHNSGGRTHAEVMEALPEERHHEVADVAADETDFGAGWIDSMVSDSIEEIMNESVVSAGPVRIHFTKENLNRSARNSSCYLSSRVLIVDFVSPTGPNATEALGCERCQSTCEASI
eukprot:SAG31_NODE_13617_length_857_cov_0.951187_1_plen_225_part_00